MKRVLALSASVLVGLCSFCSGAGDSRTTFARDALRKYADSGELPGAISVFYDNGEQETCVVGCAVVEVVTGMRWEDFLKKTVLDPLGMTNSTFRPTDGQLAGKMELYRVAGGNPAVRVACNAPMALPYNDDRVFPSAGAGLWTTANDQLKFYKMLMNLGVGENGVRVLREETVRNLLATSTRPAGIRNTQGVVDDQYSLGLWMRRGGPDDGWFGHGGAWHTTCSVNWKKRQLKLWAVQQLGDDRPWEKARDEAAEAFFRTGAGDGGTDAYTGRMN